MRNSISYRVGNEDEEKQGPKRQQQFELQVKSGVRRDHGEQISGKISQGGWEKNKRGHALYGYSQIAKQRSKRNWVFIE